MLDQTEKGENEKWWTKHKNLECSARRCVSYRTRGKQKMKVQKKNHPYTAEGKMGTEETEFGREENRGPRMNTMEV